MNLKPIRLGPIALTASVANIWSPPTATGGVNLGSSANYLLIGHLRVLNNTGSPVTISSWIGATGASAAGTEIAWPNNGVVAANSWLDYYAGSPGLRINSAEFFTAIASQPSALTIFGEGSLGVTG